MDLNAAFADYGLGAPADVVRLYTAGDFAAANHRIDVLLGQSRLPAAAKNGLLALREMMLRIPADYSMTRAEAVAALQAEISDFTEDDFDALLLADRVDWRYINGVPHYLNRFVEALRLYPDMNARGLQPNPASGIRDRVIAAMNEHGHLDADITIKATIAPAKTIDGKPVNPDAEFRAWLPVPAQCEQQSNIEILAATPGAQLAEEDAPQRTVYWQGKAGDAPYSVTYRYHIHAALADMDKIAATADPQEQQPSFYTSEEAPHIVFTPWLRTLCEDITKDCVGPVAKAKAIYDYITMNTNYRYQPAYACLEAIADNCAKSGWGDCGVMALLFITLCRIAGIPARWQSGLYVTPNDAGAHDWAQFYIAPHGWLWADCSFGSGAYRIGNETRRRHYFGNLDPLRMVANRGFYAQLTPPDECWRSDPYDNQSGEGVLDGIGLCGEALVRTREVLEFAPDAEGIAPKAKL